MPEYFKPNNAKYINPDLFLRPNSRKGGESNTVKYRSTITIEAHLSTLCDYSLCLLEFPLEENSDIFDFRS